MPTSRNRIMDQRGLTYQVAALEEKPTASANRGLAAGSTRILTTNDSGAIVLLDTAAGSTVTLPAGSTCATGTTFTFVVSVLATSNSHIVKVANASDIMVGQIETIDTTTGALLPFGTTATSDTITLNRTTTGSTRTGETFSLIYVALNRWAVSGNVVISGVAATPFSATV